MLEMYYISTVCVSACRDSAPQCCVASLGRETLLVICHLSFVIHLNACMITSAKVCCFTLPVEDSDRPDCQARPLKASLACLRSGGRSSEAVCTLDVCFLVVSCAEIKL